MNQQQTLPNPQSFFSMSTGDMQPHQQMDIQGGQLHIFPDQSALIMGNQGAQQQQQQPQGFEENLVRYMSEVELRELGMELKSAVDDDFKSQEPYYQAIADFIKELGIQLTDSSVTDGDFKHSSTVHSTAMLESALDIVLTSVGILFKENNMVDPTVIGESNQQLADTATRLKYFFNYYLTYDLKEFRSEMKRTLMWAVFAGAAHTKTYIDPVKKQPISLFIPIEDFAIHRDHSSHYASLRKTHLMYLDDNELKIRQKMGYYRDVSLGITSADYEEGSDIREELRRIRGVDDQGRANEIDRHCLAEIQHYRYMEQDPLKDQDDCPIPYITTIDRTSGEVLSIFRNWEENDPRKRANECITSWVHLPSLDGEGYGLVNTAGNLSRAATMVTRQLINAGIYANFPGFLYQKTLRLEDNNLRIAPGTGMGIATGGNKLSDSIMPLPYKEPSQALYNIKMELEDSIRRTCASSNSDKIANMNQNAPMGTTLALLESMQKIPNAVMQGFYESFGAQLEIFKKLFFKWLPEGQPYPFLVPGKQGAVMRTDFNDQIKIMPVAEPALHNSAYRLLRSEIVLNAAKASPQIHNLYQAHEFYYKSLNIPDDEINSFLPAPQDTSPKPLDPVSENANMMSGKPAVAAMEQDHQAHMIVHGTLLQHPNPQVMAAAQAHNAEHEAFMYLAQMQAQTGIQLPPDPSQVPPEVQNQIAVAMAQATLQQQQQQAAQQPPPPLDPALVALEEVKMQGQISERKSETERMKIQADMQQAEMQAQMKKQELQQRTEIDLMRLKLDTKKFELDVVAKERDSLLKEVNSLHAMHKDSTEKKD